ncbi:hypothetical protein BO94DRAFT_568592 [Aspergillus sclerotioniger CBS 115572]|uniref:Uncharacterized protein n=1 Tax=Aspergillus sclerotioniger CBS 115572 TaxID=1450535 RepID=A0A317VLI9_9EURO|nr:hypothetical protein BO94DRAFT_568592 [Aspergillus sclerotioniger CBS 115572]PWY75233.1 hypothetical protein BO94DRAFT_568592 [Aspergillus sclerotioniger CBS 115572]
MASNRSEVLLLCLAYSDFIDVMYQRLFNRLRELGQPKRAKTAAGVIRYLATNTPRAIIVADQGITEPENRTVVEKLVSYVRNGGVAIVGLHFPNFASCEGIDSFFQQAFGLPWAHGDYHRCMFAFNPACTLPPGIVPSSFPGSYSMKVLHIQHARSHEKLFVPVEGAQSAFLSISADPEQAAVVGAKVGNGYVFYSGDIYPQEESDQVILSLCGY